MEYVVYVLYSRKCEKRYVGYTSNLIDRFTSHNVLGTKGWTMSYRPWTIIHLEFFELKKEAIIREKFLKSGQGRAWLDQNIKIV